MKGFEYGLRLLSFANESVFKGKKSNNILSKSEESLVS
jgi:hypothetical protein